MFIIETLLINLLEFPKIDKTIVTTIVITIETVSSVHIWNLIQPLYLWYVPTNVFLFVENGVW